MTFNSLVTIIIPTYNRASKLSDALDSAINQTYPNTQIIVIDDGSTDDTQELLKKYPQIESHYQNNQGQASARNMGLKYSKGSIITSLDSDDIWNPDFLSECVAKLEAEQLDFVFANWEQDSKGGNSWDFLSNDPYLKPYLQKEIDHWIMLDYAEVRDLYIKSCPSPSSSMVIRKSSIVSGWDEEINIGDDWCMYLEMILTKPTKSAFTMNKLWRKRVDEINIYDGRKWSEILEFLYIADLERKMRKFKTLLKPDELSILQKRYMSSLIELSKHNLIREFNIPYALKLIRKSLAVNVPFTIREIPNRFLIGLKGKIQYHKNRR